MEDLESAILECSKCNEVEEPEQQIQEMTCDKVTTQHNPAEVDNGEYENGTSVMWPPNLGEYVIALFADGAFPGEVTIVDGDYLEADFFVKAAIVQMKKSGSLWKRPSLEKQEHHCIHKNSVLPIRPVFGVNRYSTHRIVIYDLLNADLIEKFL